MAWNEPGGSGNKDPWSGRGSDQGPPDLDEAFKNLKKKFGDFLGGSKGAGTGGGAGGAGSLGIGVIAVVLAVIWLISGIYTVDEGKRGVVLHFGAYSETTMPGLRWFPRFIQSVEVVDIENIRGINIGFAAGAANRTTPGATVSRESLMLTQDENIVDVKLAVQYKVKSASDFLFNVNEPEVTLRQATESAIREIIGKNEMDFILKEGRTEITAQSRELIQDILDRYKSGLQVTSVNLQDAQPPEPVQDAFADAVKAREDSERVKNEAETYSNDIIPRARGNAARQLAEAEAYKEKVIAEAKGEASRFEQVFAEYRKAPEVTRKRLYLESMESVLGNSSKVMVDVKSGNNIIYLPLDRMSGRNPLDMSNTSGMVEGAAAVLPEAEQLIRDNTRGRGER
jgi:membrane protease subunit HflK